MLFRRQYFQGKRYPFFSENIQPGRLVIVRSQIKREEVNRFFNAAAGSFRLVVAVR